MNIPALSTKLRILNVVEKARIFIFDPPPILDGQFLHLQPFGAHRICIWLSLVEGAMIFIFDPPPSFLSDIIFKTHLKNVFYVIVFSFFLVKFFHFLCLFKMWEIFTPHPVCIKFKRVETYEMLQYRIMLKIICVCIEFVQMSNAVKELDTNIVQKHF